MKPAKIACLTGMVLAACAAPTAHAPTPTAAAPSASAFAPPVTPTAQREYAIITLLPPDAIPAIDNPQFHSAAAADAEYAPDEMVLGVSLGGESHAYSTAYLDRHEIVNDVVGGRKIAVTW
jgi:hypothetical protein